MSQADDEPDKYRASSWTEFFSDRPQDKLRVFDWSVSGFETCVVVHGQGFRLALDIGACPPQAISADIVFISHGHLDHCGALHQHMRRRQLVGLPPATYYVPEHLVQPLTDIVRLFGQVHGDNDDEEFDGGARGSQGKGQAKNKRSTDRNRKPMGAKASVSSKAEYEGKGATGNKKETLAGSKGETPTGSKDGNPTGSKDETPTGSKDGNPTGSKDEAPTGSKNDTPAGSKDETLTGSKNDTPAGSKDETPTGSKNDTPTGSKDETPTGSKNDTPTGSKDETLTGSKNDTPAGSKDETPTGSKNDTPTGSKDKPTTGIEDETTTGNNEETLSGNKNENLSGSRDKTPTGSKDQAATESYNESAASRSAEFYGKIVVALPGEDIILSKNLRLRPLATDHRVPSIGCILYSRRSQLLPQYVGLPGQQLAELARNGEQLREYRWEPTIGYTGDTRFTVLAYPPESDLLCVKLLISELTYIEGPTNLAEKHGHCHLHDFASANPNLFTNVGQLLFVHFSRRYSPDRVLNAVLTALPDELKCKVFCGLNALRFYQV